MLEEKLDDGIPAPNEKPLDDELLEAGIVMQADSAIASKQQKIVATIRAIHAIATIIFPRGAFANKAQLRRTGTHQFGCPARTVLAFSP